MCACAVGGVGGGRSVPCTAEGLDSKVQILRLALQAEDTTCEKSE